MTLDEFRSQYRLLQRLTQRGVASYQATDASGRVVMVHSLDSASRDEVDHVRGMLHALGPADRTKILTILDVDGAPIVVTEYLQGFETLARWLELRTRGDATLPGTTPVKPDREPVGNFTELFGPPQPPKAPVLEGPPVPAEGSKEAGEFTRMFGALPQQQSDKPQSPPQTPSTPTSLPPPAPPPPPAQSEPPKVVVRWRDGSPVESAPRDPKPLIRWKQAGSPERAPAPAPAPPPAAPAPPPAKTPGEFTRLFGPQDGASLRGDDDPGSVPPVRPQAPLPEPLEALPPPLPPRAPPSAGGGFTQLLRAAADVPDDSASPHELGGALPPPPATGTPAQQGEFTRLMAGLPPSPGSGAAAPRTPAPAGPSEFTRMMSGVPTPPPPVPRAAPPPAEPTAEEEGARPAPVMLFVALGVVFVLAAAVVVFFALR